MPDAPSETCEAVSLKRYSMLLSSPFFILASQKCFYAGWHQSSHLGPFSHLGNGIQERTEHRSYPLSNVWEKSIWQTNKFLPCLNQEKKERRKKQLPRSLFSCSLCLPGIYRPARGDREEVVCPGRQDHLLVPVPLKVLKDCGVGRSEYIMSWKELDLENQTDLNLNPGSNPF